MIPLSSSSVSRPEAGSGFASSSPTGVVSRAAQRNGGLQRAQRCVRGARSGRVLVVCRRPHREPGNCSMDIAGCEEWGRRHRCFSPLVESVSCHWGFHHNPGLDAAFLSEWKTAPVGTIALRPSGGRAQGSSGLSAQTWWHRAQQVRGTVKTGSSLSWLGTIAQILVS